MIINIRGTSGSGKSTLVRNVLKHLEKVASVKVAGRKQPIGYTYRIPATGKMLAVLGHYETACGGCDTINKMDEVFLYVKKAHEDGMHVLFEGLLISSEVNRVVTLHEQGLPLHVVALDTPLDLCLASVNERRRRTFQERLDRIRAENAELEAQGRKKRLEEPEERGEVNPKNTESKFKGVKLSVARLQEAGVSCSWESRNSAEHKILSLFEAV